MFCSTLITLGQGQERKEKEVGSSSLSNTFDDDCRYRNSEIEDITRWREDMNFMFENIKFISSSQRVMFFLLYGETISTKAKGGNRDVIERYDTHKGDIRKIRHSGPGWSGVWNLRVVKFPVKHSPPYNKPHNTHTHNHVNRGYYMAARGYEFYLRALKVSLTRSLGSWEILSAGGDKIRIPKRLCNVLFIL